MKNQKINIHNEANINAIGDHNCSKCKSVICKETGDIYSSIIDAAKGAGVGYQMMVGHLRGRYKSVKGKHYAYLSDVLDNPDVMFAKLREVTEVAAANAKIAAENAEDARKWREYQAEQEAIRKAEEKRLEDERKAREAHAAKKAKAEARAKRLQEKCERISDKLILNRNKLEEALKELDELNAMEVTAA